ncbi:Siroheme synthase [Nymphon striatum]|nr:Siroheme synthase [Nymphon striatum]
MGFKPAAAEFAKRIADKNARVLDAGCGTGLSGVALHKEGFTDIEGRDLSPEMLDEARKTDVYTLLEEVDLTRPIKVSEKYDAIFSCGVFGFGPPDPCHLPHLLNLLKPGGFAVITVNGKGWLEKNWSEELDKVVEEHALKLEEQLDIEYLENEDIDGKLLIFRDSLPNELGLLAKLAEYFRPKASNLPQGRTRRKFWSRYFYDLGPAALREGGKHGATRTLDTLFDEAQNEAADVGRVFLVGSGPGDPDLLTRKALKVLHEADVIIHDRLVSPQILELARREAMLIQTGKQGFGPSWKQEDINALMVEHAQKGAQIVRLKSGDPTVFGRLDEEMDALDEAGIYFEIIPGITTASAAAASLNVSLTKRKRNSALQIMTAQDIKGFAEQDWRKLSDEGSVAAIYMGFKSAHLLSGRLLMHGADANTPVTIMENVSRANQKTLVSTIGDLPNMADQAGHDGTGYFDAGS